MTIYLLSLKYSQAISIVTQIKQRKDWKLVLEKITNFACFVEKNEATKLIFNYI